MPKNIGICFSVKFRGNNPLKKIGPKLPVYLRLLDLVEQKGWQPLSAQEEITAAMAFLMELGSIKKMFSLK